MTEMARRCPLDDTKMAQDVPHGRCWICPTCEQFFTEALLEDAAAIESLRSRLGNV